MNNSTSDISNQTRGFDIGSTIFFYEKGRCSVFPSMRLTPNIRKIFSYLFGISALENNTEHLTSFLIILEAQQLWAQLRPCGRHLQEQYTPLECRHVQMPLRPCGRHLQEQYTPL